MRKARVVRGGLSTPLDYVPKIARVASTSAMMTTERRFVDVISIEWNWVTREIVANNPQMPEKLSTAINVISEFIDELTEVLADMCKVVVKRAKEKGIFLHVRKGSCRRENCGICFGVMETHYPWFYYSKEGRKTKIKTVDLRDFLRGVGLSEGWIERFIRLILLRRVFVCSRNWAMKCAYHLGLIDIDLEEGEEEE